MTQQWCACGGLDALIAKGEQTRRVRDLQGRVVREVRADGITATTLAYETTTSRVKSVTDPKQQVATYAYNLDNTVQQVSHTNAMIATPSLSYAYRLRTSSRDGNRASTPVRLFVRTGV